MIWVLFVWTGEDRMQGVGGGRGRRHGVGLVAALVMVAGCTDGSGGGGGTPSSSTSSTTATIPAAITPASPSPTTSLSAKDQAAAEAKAAYRKYERTVDEVYRGGGVTGDSELPKVAYGEQLTVLLQQARALRKDKARQVGGSAVRALNVDSVALPSNKNRLPQVSLTACVDYSKQGYVDAEGRPIGATNGPTLFKALVIVTSLDPTRWRVTSEQSTPVKSC